MGWERELGLRETAWPMAEGFGPVQRKGRERERERVGRQGSSCELGLEGPLGQEKGGEMGRRKGKGK